MKYPKMVRVKQHFNTSPIKDIAAKVRAELAGIQPQKMIARGLPSPLRPAAAASQIWLLSWAKSSRN